MRIGLIAPPWVPVPPPAYGGTEAVMDRLARGLVRAGHDVVLAAAADSTCPVDRVPGTAPAGDRAPLCADTVAELRHVVTSYAAMDGVDVVHDHTVVGPVYRHRPRSTPVVTTNHGPFDADSTPVYRAMRDTAVVAISRHQASMAAGVAIAAVIHHGIDVDAVPVGRGDGGYASFLGRMSPDKGPRQAALIARAAGVPLRMAAKLREPAERDYFEAAVKPLLCSDVEYVGELGLHDKLELVGASFALLNPLQWAEPFGLVMIEALATGTPVVGTPAGAAPEIIDDGLTGFLRAGRLPLAAALLHAAELDRTACRAAASERFDTEHMVSKHVRLYTTLLTGRAPTLPETRRSPCPGPVTGTGAPAADTAVA
ncbi:MAG: glycosyl transferase family 1 [Modestobacter sp.]|jgi:glycosyltransferase involved in cell wall biosynthesis|nr:glycosyl transferase family 1 [Modestobacter sp.]